MSDNESPRAFGLPQIPLVPAEARVWLQGERERSPSTRNLSPDKQFIGSIIAAASPFWGGGGSDFLFQILLVF
jgi:hypothetical protein